MNYSPLNIQNENLTKPNWLIKQNTEYSYIINAKISEEYLRPYVSEHFQIDKFQQSPYISLVIVKNRSLSFKYLPFVKNKNSFHIYLRTYIKRNGIPGHFYISIDTNHKKLNHIFKTLTDFPINDSSIKSITDSVKTQIDSSGKSLNLYANLEKKSERFLFETNDELNWMQNRFNIFNLQKGQVVNWKLDYSPERVFKTKVSNLQVYHSSLPLGDLNFNSIGYFIEGNTIRIWPPSLL